MSLTTASTRHECAAACASSTGAKRIRAYLGGELVADTIRPLLVWEKPYYPAYYFPARGRPRRAADTRRRRRPLSKPRRRAHLHRDGRRQGGERRRPAVRAVAIRGATRCDPARMGRHGRLVRGGRAGLHASPRPVHPRRHPPELAARPGRGRRSDDRGDGEADAPLRDRSPHALLRAQDTRPHGPADADRERQPLPVQGSRPSTGRCEWATTSAPMWRGRTRRRSPRARRSPG